VEKSVTRHRLGGISAKQWPWISSRPSFLDDGKKLLDFRIQFGKLKFQNRFSGMQHHVHGADQLPQAPLHRRPQAAPDAVAFDRSAQHLAYGKSHAGAGLVAAFTVKHGHIPRKMLPALLVNRLKVRMLQQP
jgi:hypothetical protein